MVTIDGQKELILDLLQQSERLQLKDLPKVYDLQTKHTESVEEALVRSKLVTEDDIAKIYADFFGLTMWTISGENESLREQLDGLESLIPEKICRDRILAPIALRDKTLCVAAASPRRPELLRRVAIDRRDADRNYHRPNFRHLPGSRYPLRQTRHGARNRHRVERRRRRRPRPRG